MGLEDLTGPDKFLDAFNVSWPTGDDDIAEGDDHVRGVKNVVVNTFGALDRLYDLNLVSFWNPGATGAMFIPQGTTAQQPSSPVAGEWRYNTETQYFERWNGSAWVYSVAVTGADNVHGAGSRQTFGRYVDLVRTGGGTGSPQPVLDQRREGITASDNLALGSYRFSAPTDAATETIVNYSEMIGRAVTVEDGNHNGGLQFRTAVDGSSLSRRVTITNGMSVGSATDPIPDGNGTINVGGAYYRSGVQVSAYESPATAIVLGGTHAFEHGLGGRAKLYQAYLVCKNAVGGWVVGDELLLNVNGSRQGGSAGDTSVWGLWTEDDTHIRLQVPDRNFHITQKNSGTYIEQDGSNWDVVVRASGW